MKTIVNWYLSTNSDTKEIGKLEDFKKNVVNHLKIEGFEENQLKNELLNKDKSIKVDYGLYPDYNPYLEVNSSKPYLHLSLSSINPEEALPTYKLVMDLLKKNHDAHNELGSIISYKTPGMWNNAKKGEILK